MLMIIPSGSLLVRMLVLWDTEMVTVLFRYNNSHLIGVMSGLNYPDTINLRYGIVMLGNEVW